MLTNVTESSKGNSSEGSGSVDSPKDLVQENESIAESNPTTPQIEKPEGESSTSEANKDEPKTSTKNHTSGLYFVQERKLLHSV